MAGEGSGGAAPEPCDGKCKDETPFCDVKTDECVGCLKQTDCKDPTKPMCSLDWVCVPCLNDASCTDTLGLPKPVVCLNGDSIERPFIEARPNTGECAECGMSKDCGGAICDLETLTCIEGTLFKGKGLCDECTDDRECKDGQLCVEMTFDDPVDGVVGTFCLWRRDATELSAPKGTCGINSRPYSKLMPAITSANGVVTDVCAPRSTTCPSVLQFSTTVPGCDMAGDDDACGDARFNDGKCRLNSDGEPRCTYSCSGEDGRDCPGGISCKEGDDRYCEP